MLGGMAMFLLFTCKMSRIAVRWLALVWNIAVPSRQHVPAQANHHLMTRQKKRQTEHRQLAQPDHFSFSQVIFVTFEPVAADSHTREEVNT